MIPEIVEHLKRAVEGKGIEVYAKKDIPEHLHWRNNENTPPILLLARPGTYIMKAPRNLQRPMTSHVSQK